MQNWPSGFIFRLYDWMNYWRYAGAFFLMGNEMKVTIDYDNCDEFPWEWNEGHGPVRMSTRSHISQSGDKKPGERPLNDPCRNEYQFYYDWQSAIKRAKHEGWNAAPYDAPNPALRAVQADFDRLRAYLREDWYYCIVTVESECGNYVESCGMVESDYADDMAKELTDNILRQIEQDAHAAKVSSRFNDAMECGV